MMPFGEKRRILYAYSLKLQSFIHLSVNYLRLIQRRRE
ncbi:hypothetical protein MHA_1936 [Mannheimia haemolytica PHL213]|nr:hypothetical protein MHA_1936 [Mannheimia haemolytica PHL213]